MSVLFILMRLLHILGAIVWAGGSIVMVAFVLPSVKATAPSSARFIQYLTGPAGLPKWMSIAGFATVLAGIGMYVNTSGHFDPSWMRTRQGLAFTAGGVIGILVLLEGLFVTRVAATKLGALGQQVAASGGPPSPEQAQMLQALQGKLGKSAARGAWMLGTTAALMAVARYL